MRVAFRGDGTFVRQAGYALQRPLPDNVVKIVTRPVYVDEGWDQPFDSREDIWGYEIQEEVQKFIGELADAGSHAVTLFAANRFCINSLSPWETPLLLRLITSI